MRIAKKMLAVMLMAVMFLGLFTGIRAEAAETGTPKISLKYVNSKTGVKIIIGKTAGADAYSIYLTGYGSSYADYLNDDIKFKERKVALIEKNGKAKRTYTINGLPKGTYTIKVAALQKVIEDDHEYYGVISYSEEKTIKIKAPKAVKTEEKTYDFSKAKVGDTITFGSYEQDGIMTNGKEDIEWIVLSKNKSQMLVVSKYALELLSYNTEYTDVTWENCTLRRWLNNSFYKTAFTKAERSLIKKTKLRNADNPQYETKGGNDTKDKVFLLSLDDIINTGYGFSSELSEEDIIRRCTPTEYALAALGYTTEYFIEDNSLADDYLTAEGGYTCWWWLRSPGYNEKTAANVDYDGSIFYEHKWNQSRKYYHCGGVRPALVINLQS